MRTIKLILLLTLSFALTAAQSFLRKDVEIQWVKGGDLAMARAIFKRAYQERYKDILPEKLQIDNLPAFLDASFDKEERDLKGNSKTHLALAHIQTRLVGFVSIDILEGGKVYLRQLAVAPDLWHQGIEDTLINSIFETDPSIKHISIVLRRSNEDEKAFYKNFGFQETTYMHEGFDPTDYIGLELSRKG